MTPKFDLLMLIGSFMALGSCAGFGFFSLGELNWSVRLFELYFVLLLVDSLRLSLLIAGPFLISEFKC